MGHEKLIEALAAETNQTAKIIVDDAQKQADHLIQNAKDDAEKLMQHKLNAISQETERNNTAKKNAYISSLKGNLNSVKYSLMNQTLDDVLLEFKNLPKEKIRDALIKLFDNLLAHIDDYEKAKTDVRGKLYASTETTEVIKDYAKSKKAELFSGDVDYGFLFVSDDEKIKTRSSMTSVIESIKPTLLIELKEILFGDL